MIKVLQVFKDIKQKRLIRSVNCTVTINIRHFYFCTRHDDIAFSSELEYTFNKFNIRLRSARHTVHIGPCEYTESFLEKLYIISVYIAVKINVCFLYILFCQVHLDRFDNRSDIIKIKLADIAVTVNVKRGNKHVFYYLFIFDGNESVSVNIGTHDYRTRYPVRSGNVEVRYRLAVTIKQQLAIITRLVPCRYLFELIVYVLNPDDLSDIVTGVYNDYDFLAGYIGYFYTFFDHVTVTGIQYKCRCGAIPVHYL